MNRALRPLCAWTVFFLISAGLGYPTLNRYDPRVAVPDAAIYTRMASQGPSLTDTHLRFRVLVPYLARAVFGIARTHTGSWDPMLFSFLVVNALFVATSAYLLFGMGCTIARQSSVALLAASLYLLNFAVANAHLAALVDSGEAFFLTAIIATLFRRRWALLPLWAILGTLVKESFVPFSIAILAAWWITSAERGRRLAFWIAIASAVELATLVSLQWAVSGHALLPWTFAASMNSPTSYLANLGHSLIDRNSWYILIWLLPLGIAGRRLAPLEWKAASATGVVVALLLNAYHSTVGGGGGGLGRYVFNVAGPLLSFAAAAFLTQWLADIRLTEN